MYTGGSSVVLTGAIVFVLISIPVLISINGIDRSDQLIGTNNVMRKCLRWWKTLFFHFIDIAIVNGFFLFQEHQANFPDDENLQRPPGTRSVILGRRLLGKFVFSLSMLTPL